MEDMLTRGELKGNGWTDGLIKKFLPIPDRTALNPKYASAPMMKLYSQDRVKAIEASPEFIEALAKAESRKVSARKAVETKRKRMTEYLENLTIEVPVLEFDELKRRASENFRSLELSDRVEISDERMCVNYLRHCLTTYERELKGIAGKTGATDAYYEIKEKVLDAIWEEYPWLADECQQQLSRMWKEQSDRM